jgi:mannose-6-phosphate isomerase-like protein (cupin superfamily)
MKKLDSTINIRQKLDLIHEHWSPRIIAQLNDYHVKLAKIEGEFIWHSHPETDEAFWVLSGRMRILFRDGAVTLNEGELFVVPRGVEHKPVAEQECAILLLEPAGTVNTGDAGGELTVSETPWI